MKKFLATTVASLAIIGAAYAAGLSGGGVWAGAITGGLPGCDGCVGCSGSGTGAGAGGATSVERRYQLFSLPAVTPPLNNR